MGNAPPSKHDCFVEVRLCYPMLDVPIGAGGQPCTLFARVGIAEDRLHAVHSLWDEPSIVRLPGPQCSLLIQVLAAEPGLRSLEDIEVNGQARLLSEISIPYEGPGGLLERGVSLNGPPVNFTVSLGGPPTNTFPAGPSMSVAIRELLGPQRQGAGDTVQMQTMDSAMKSSVLTTNCSTIPHLQQDWLQGQHYQQQDQQPSWLQGQQYSPRYHQPDQQPGSRCVSPLNSQNRVAELRMLLQQNDQLRGETHNIQQRTDHMRTMLAEEDEYRQKKQDWGKTLRVMHSELTHCKERQRMLQQRQEEKIRSLKTQLRQVEENIPEPALPKEDILSSEIQAMATKVDQAKARRNDLTNQLQDIIAELKNQELNGIANDSSNARIQQLKEQSERQKAELATLQQELALEHEKEQGSQQAQDLRSAVAQLADELEELERACEDERVRSESEVRELKSERDALKDRSDDAVASLQRLRSQAHALRNLQAEIAGGSEESVTELRTVKQENEATAADLQRLRTQEEDHRATIRKLEQEQEALVEATSQAMAQAGPGSAVLRSADDSQSSTGTALKARVEELQRDIDIKEASCAEQLTYLDTLKSEAEEAQRVSQALRRSYDALQQSSDERMMHSPMVSDRAGKREL